MTRDEVHVVLRVAEETASAKDKNADDERRRPVPDMLSIESFAAQAVGIRYVCRMLAAGLEKSEAARLAKIDDFIRARLIDGPRSPHGIMRMISWSFEGDAATEADACLARIGATYRDGLWGFYEVTP
jgi:hypothetical protein